MQLVQFFSFWKLPNNNKITTNKYHKKTNWYKKAQIMLISAVSRSFLSGLNAFWDCLYNMMRHWLCYYFYTLIFSDLQIILSVFPVSFIVTHWKSQWWLIRINHFYIFVIIFDRKPVINQYPKALSTLWPYLMSILKSLHKQHSIMFGFRIAV